jgi:hypothetical protein
MSAQNTAMKQLYQKGVLNLEEPSETKPDQAEVMVEASGLPDGPSGGTIEMLCTVAASQAPPVFIDPYAFLEALREEKMAKYRAKRDPRWEGLITAPEKARQATAFRKVRA